jgi:hypothetical protein
MVAWTSGGLAFKNESVGFWFNETKRVFCFGGPQSSIELGRTLCTLAQKEARKLKMMGAFDPPIVETVGDNRWRITLRLPLGRSLVHNLTEAIQREEDGLVHVQGPVKSFGRLTY